MKINNDQKNLIENNVVVLATIDENSCPNVIPVAFVKIVENKVVITDNFMKQTKENIANCEEVCLAVWSDDWKEGYKLTGKATYFEQGKWKKFIDEIKENKDMPAKGAIVIKIKNIFKLQ